MGNCIITRRNFDQGGNPPVSIVSWANGTDAEIKAMIDAADAGSITLSDYWSVGDERTVHLDAMTVGDAFTTAMAAQDVVLVLMDTGAQSGYVDVNDNPVNYVVGQKDLLIGKGQPNTTATNVGSWRDCAVRADLNSKYYNALPSTFRGCLKQFKTITAETSSTNQTTNDYIALFAEKEIIGQSTYSSATEAAALNHIEYYKTASNRVKQSSTGIHNWWERSIYTSNTSYFLYISSGGASYTYYANDPDGIAPFMCI